MAVRVLRRKHGREPVAGPQQETAAGAEAAAAEAGPAAEPEQQPVHHGPVLQFEDNVGTVPLVKSEVVIGRHSQDDIRVPDVRVSRHHARLRLIDGGKVELTNLTADRSEPNPVTVNGVEKEHAVLVDGDRVSLGGVVFTLRMAG